MNSMLKIIPLLATFSISILASAEVCTREDVELYYQDRYDSFINNKFFKTEGQNNTSLCENVKKNNTQLINGFNEANNFLEDSGVNASEPVCLPEIFTRENQQLATIEDALIFSQMKAFCERHKGKAFSLILQDEDDFFHNVLIKAPKESIFGRYFQSLGQSYYNQKFNIYKKEIKRLKCLDYLSSSSCQYDQNQNLDQIIAMLGQKNLTSTDECLAYKDDFCASAMAPLKAREYQSQSNSGQSFAITVSEGSTAQLFSRFQTGQNDMFSSLCFYQSIKEKLGCENESEYFNKSLSLFQIAFLFDEDKQLSRNNCQKEGIAITTDTYFPKLSVYPNPMPSTSGNINIKLKGGSVENCSLQFKMFTSNGSEILNSSSWFDISADGEFQIPLPTNLPSSNYFLKIDRARCSDKEFPVENSKPFTISII